MKRRFVHTFLVLAIAVIGLVPVAAAAPSRPAKPLAGPWYTPAELKALIRYSNASFPEKQRILAGETTGSTSSGSFHWGDAGVGAGVAVAVLLVAGVSARVLLQTHRVGGSSHA
jgi:hypothetical protein